jgi:hypothetical protein
MTTIYQFNSTIAHLHAACEPSLEFLGNAWSWAAEEHRNAQLKAEHSSDDYDPVSDVRWSHVTYVALDQLYGPILDAMVRYRIGLESKREHQLLAFELAIGSALN